MKRAFFPILIGCTLALAAIVETIGLLNGVLFGMSWLVILWAIGGFFYLLPTYVGWRREHHALLAIFITNLFLGWTFLGWVAALIWACTPVKRERQLTELERELIQRSIGNQLSI
ncbi:Superinfection immunity protein [Bradyrhizobium erythrophlei]|nr:Superinfection immunity protein [Bradyrhizobium erythrophlei]